jgi:hypothetical protein
MAGVFSEPHVVSVQGFTRTPRSIRAGLDEHPPFLGLVGFLVRQLRFGSHRAYLTLNPLHTKNDRGIDGIRTHQYHGFHKGSKPVNHCLYH